MMPWIFPWASRRGAEDTLTSTWDPFFRDRTVSYPARLLPRVTVSRISRVSASLPGAIVGTERPTTSRAVHPKMRSAAGFHLVTLPGPS